MLEKFEIEIASIPNQENLVSEIFYEGEQWVQIYFSNDELLIHFFSPSNKNFWKFPFELALQVLEKAKKKLYEVEFDH